MLEEFRRLSRVVVWTVLSSMATSSWAWAGNGESKFIARNDEAGRKYAIVIGVSALENKSQGVKELFFVENDVRRMVETLYNDGFIVWPLCEENVALPSDANRVKSVKKPTKANIEKTVEKVMKEARANDRVLIYFSGHGDARKEKGKKGKKTFLFPRDGDTEDDKKLLAAQYLRDSLEELKSEKGARGLLVLDSCYSGGARLLHPDYDDCVQNFVENDSSIPTFASCAGNQESWPCDPILEDPDDVANDGQEHRVSGFTYWLNLGLRGFADGADGEPDGKIDTRELLVYVNENYKFQWRGGRAEYQEPTLVASGDAAPFVLCDAVAMEKNEALTAAVKQIVTKAKILGKATVSLDVETVGAASVAAKAGDALGAFALNAQNYMGDKIDALMRREDESDDSKSTGNVDVKATVELTTREVYDEQKEGTKEVDEYLVTCRFDEEEIKGAVGEVKVRVSLADAGETFERETPPADAIPVAPVADSAPDVDPSGVSDRPEPEPLDVPFTTPIVRIDARLPGSSAWTTRPIYRTADGANWVELNPGEVYRVVLEPSKQPEAYREVGARLLIDGRNTLAQAEPKLYVGTRAMHKREKTSGRSSKTSGTPVVAPAVSLNEARWWIATPSQGATFDGFYRDIEERGDEAEATRAEFVVAPADELGGATGQNGLIDVAFYELIAIGTRGANSDVATAPGAETRKVVRLVVGKKLGRELASFRLRYASAAMLASVGVDAKGLVGPTEGAEVSGAEEAIGTRSAKKRRAAKKVSREDEDEDEDEGEGVWL